MPHNTAAMRSHCGGVLRMFILTGESFYLIVLHLRYLGHEGVARQAGTCVFGRKCEFRWRGCI